MADVANLAGYAEGYRHGREDVESKLRQLHRPETVGVAMKVKPKSPTTMEDVVVCASCDRLGAKAPVRYPCPTAQLLDEL